MLRTQTSLSVQLLFENPSKKKEKGEKKKSKKKKNEKRKNSSKNEKSESADEQPVEKKGKKGEGKTKPKQISDITIVDFDNIRNQIPGLSQSCFQ